MMFEANFSGESEGSDYFIDQDVYNPLAKKLNLIGYKQCFCTFQPFSFNTVIFVQSLRSPLLLPATHVLTVLASSVYGRLTCSSELERKSVHIVSPSVCSISGFFLLSH